MNTKISKNILIIGLMMNFLLGVFLLMYSVHLFDSGFHNFDTAQNMKYLEGRFDIKVYDQTSDFNIYDNNELYIIGTNQTRKAFYLMFASGLFLGITYLGIASIGDMIDVKYLR